jgi:hypothetical protein
MLGWLCWWRPPFWRRRVIVNLIHDPTEAFEGILWAYSWGGWLTLKEVSALKAGVPPAPIPGDVVMHRSNLAYTQVLL